MDDELKGCPFCGSEAEVFQHGIAVGVCCKECGASVEDTEWFLAIEKWNRRETTKDKMQCQFCGVDVEIGHMSWCPTQQSEKNSE